MSFLKTAADFFGNLFHAASDAEKEAVSNIHTLIGQVEDELAKLTAIRPSDYLVAAINDTRTVLGRVEAHLKEAYSAADQEIDKIEARVEEAVSDVGAGIAKAYDDLTGQEAEPQPVVEAAPVPEPQPEPADPVTTAEPQPQPEALAAVEQPSILS